jgi:hypothetical protein
MVGKALTGLPPKKATEQGWVAKSEGEQRSSAKRSLCFPPCF